MSKSRPTIGRTFNSPVLKSEPSDEEFQQVFTLTSGRKVRFTLIRVSAPDVERTTFVVLENNGRDQSALTAESLKDITRTIRLQQFFPAIGVRKNDVIEILDGSRRRVSAILSKCGLDVLTTDENLTPAEARALAKDIQTAREHNLREVGLRLQTLKNSGLSQKDIAESENLSQATVTRALQAASVPQKLISVFPVQAVLSFADYKSLLSIEEILSVKGIELSELISNLNDVFRGICDDVSLADDEVKNKLIAEIRKEAMVLGSSSVKDKTVTTPIWKFEDKNRFARKKTKGRMFSYEFNRLSPELQNAIDEALQKILSDHLEK